MDKKPKIGALFTEAGKTAKGLLDYAARVADQNDDGKFNMEDIAVMADSMGTAVKNGVLAVKECADQKAQALELNAMRPIFPEALTEASFMMPKFIRLCPRDKKHANSPLCKGSIGYDSSSKEMNMITIFSDSIDSYNLSFYPDRDSEFYYVDPCDQNRYISLDDYFSYLKIVRVNELQKLAQDLGAKHFRVTYKEEQTSFSEKKVKAHGKAGVVTLDAEHKTEEKKFSRIEIAAENSFPGHEPMAPSLNYMEKDPSVQNLVAMRLDKAGALTHQKYMLQLSHSSGMKESEAAKIDTILKKLKFTGNTTVASEAKNEARRYLEYEIEF